MDWTDLTPMSPFCKAMNGALEFSYTPPLMIVPLTFCTVIVWAGVQRSATPSLFVYFTLNVDNWPVCPATTTAII